MTQELRTFSPAWLRPLGLLLALSGLRPAAFGQQATFALQPNSPSAGSDSYPTNMAIADVNGDGKLDAITANYFSDNLGVLLGDGKGRFILQANSPSTGLYSNPNSVAVADINGDGKLDAITANHFSGSLGVLLGDGKGKFILQANSPSTGLHSTPYSVALGNVNADGNLDALVTDVNSGALVVLLGDGKGNLVVLFL